MKRATQKLKEAVQILIQDIDAFETDWEKLLTEKDLAMDHLFLEKMSKDIKRLNEDTILIESLEPNNVSAHMVQHMITTPWGAPFVSDKTLLEAALSYPMQDPKNSDLCHLMDDFTEYSSLSHNQFLTILSSLSEDLRRSAH